jgi:hypothetical protein
MACRVLPKQILYASTKRPFVFPSDVFWLSPIGIARERLSRSHRLEDAEIPFLVEAFVDAADR